MGNFWRALGYATPALNMTARTMMEYGRQMREAPLQKAESEARIAESEMNRAVSTERLEALRNQNLLAMQEQERKSKPVNMKSYLDEYRRVWGDEVAQKWEKRLAGTYMDENGISTQGQIEEVQKMFMTERALRKEFQADVINGYQSQIRDLGEKISKKELSGESKEDTWPLRQQKQILQDRLDNELGNYAKLDRREALYNAVKGRWNEVPEQLKMLWELAKTGDERSMDRLEQGLVEWLKSTEKTTQENLTEADYLALPENDPRKIQYLRGLEQKSKLTREPEKPPAPSDFDKKWKAAKDTLPANSTNEQIADKVKKMFGSPSGMRMQGRGILQTGESVVYDPSDGVLHVVSPSGESEPYDPSEHGAIMPTVGRQIPGGEVGKMGEIQSIINNIGIVKNLYGYGTDKEHSEWVGPVKGRVGGIEEKFLGTASPQQAKFYYYVRDMQDALLRARSGAQINEQEYQRLTKFVPNPNLPPESFKASIDRFEDQMKNVLSSKEKQFTEKGYAVPNKEKQPSDDLRKKAIKVLKDAGKPVTDANIDYILQQMK